jgi:hypothetical protein
MTRRSPLVVLLALPLLLGHGDGCGCGDGGVEFGDPTGAVCPDEGTTLTYENFAAPFMAAYCVRCHSSEVTGADRNGAPSDHNFDTHFEIVAFTDHIDWMTGSGPDATNTQMPPDGSKPSLEERQKLSEWLACGGPPPLN